MADPVDERREQVRKAMVSFIRAWREAMLPIIAAVRDFGERFYEAAWEAYRQAGMCYGETDDGMWRWLRECAEAERLRRRAEELELYHRQMAVFRVAVVGGGGGGEEGGIGGNGGG